MCRFFAVVIVFLALTMGARAGALLDAVKAGDLAAAEAAISQGADVNEKSGFLTPLVAAIRAANHDMAALLLAKGADPNKAAGSNTPLLMACGTGDTKFVEMLLAKGADPRLAANSMTALHRAAESGCLSCAKLLVAAGADVNALTDEGTPAIHLAMLAGHGDFAAFLIAKGYVPPKFPPVSPALKAADVVKGKTVFDATCGKCHRFNEKFVAPPLEGIVGAAKASQAGQEYTDVLKAAGGTWTYEELNALIANPGATFPGTSMSFRGLPDAGERADVIAYLRSHTPNPPALP
jgi:cytochrome c